MCCCWSDAGQGGVGQITLHQFAQIYNFASVGVAVSDLTQNATLAAGKTLVEAGNKLIDCCTRK